MAKTEGFTVVLIGVWSRSMLSVDILDQDGFTVCRLGLHGGRLHRDRAARVGAEGGAEAAGTERRENRPSSVTMRVLMVKSCSNTSQQMDDN